MQADIKLTITRLTPPKIAMLLNVVAEHMTDNPNFLQPAVPPASLFELNRELLAAHSEAEEGSRLSKAKRNGLVSQAKDLLRKQANYVRSVALGDRQILISSGFQLQRERTRIGSPAVPVMKGVSSISYGQIKVRWGRVHGAKAYKLFVTKPDASAPELVTVTTSASYTVVGLESYKPHYFSVQAIGTAGISLPSDSILGVAA